MAASLAPDRLTLLLPMRLNRRSCATESKPLLQAAPAPVTNDLLADLPGVLSRTDQAEPLDMGAIQDPDSVNDKPDQHS